MMKDSMYYSWVGTFSSCSLMLCILCMEAAGPEEDGCSDCRLLSLFPPVSMDGLSCTACSGDSSLSSLFKERFRTGLSLTDSPSE